METKERERDDGGVADQDGGGSACDIGGPGNDERASQLAEAGDRAIRNALSKDSARFLAQNQQEGGQ